MKIFSSKEIKDWDNYTIQHEPVASVDLMERAAKCCYQWLADNNYLNNIFKVFCGKGNNGGDGLALARMLKDNKCVAHIYILKSESPGSIDFLTNVARTHPDDVHLITSEIDFPQINKNDIIIDALFGTGLNKPFNKTTGLLVEYINHSNASIISIDIPSGLYADKSSKENIVIRAAYTLTFQQYKLAFFMAENEQYFGSIILLNIHLHPGYYGQHETQYEFIDVDKIKFFLRPRKLFSNKGDFGHACLLAGSYGMMGAAVLAANACLRSGVGKLTCVVCKKGYDIIQISVPGAMCKVYGNTFIKVIEDDLNFNAIGIGPGIGIHQSHEELLRFVFAKADVNLILDADALNTISKNKELLNLLPQHCIITPHPKEFDRLFGPSNNDFKRMELALKKSAQYSIFIILKGHHTLITTPEKKAYFNSTGNAGMAKGGSGDVLTGILTSFVAQGYPSLQACLLAVYLHGLAGDIAAEKFSQEAMIAEDITDCLSEAFKQVRE